MSSYLEIYLQKKKKDGEESGERLLLCSISRTHELYGLFYDNSIGRFADENNYHKFSSDDLDSLTIDIDEAIERVTDRTNSIKENLPFVSNKDVINDMLESLDSNKEYIKQLIIDKSTINALYIIFKDINEDLCDFDGLYWKIS